VFGVSLDKIAMTFNHQGTKYKLNTKQIMEGENILRVRKRSNSNKTVDNGDDESTAKKMLRDDMILKDSQEFLSYGRKMKTPTGFSLVDKIGGVGLVNPMDPTSVSSRLNSQKISFAKEPNPNSKSQHNLSLIPPNA